MIHWELCKKLKFDHTTKKYMHKPESVFENEKHQILWDFEIQTDHQLPVRRLYLVIINKRKTYQIVDFAIPTDHRVKFKENKKRNRYLDLA